jgi:hypothetical protein
MGAPAIAIWAALIGTAGLLMAFARTGPDEAVSNLSRWVEYIGFHRIPAWLRARNADRWAYRGGMLAMAILLFVGGMGFDGWIRGPVPFGSPSAIDVIGGQRRLSDDRKSRLTRELAKLLPVISQMAVTNVNGDQESEIYMHDFADAFRRAGIEPIFTWTSPDGPDQVGVYIAVREGNARPPVAAMLQGALRTIGVDADIVPFPKAKIVGAQEPGPVAIYVAPRPL